MARLRVSEVKALEAFEHYYKQGLEGLSERSFKATADAVGLPVATVRRIAKEENWDAKIAERAAIVTEKVEERVNESVADIKAGYHKKVKKIIDAWFEKHFGGELSEVMLMTMDVDQFIKLVKLNLVLLGEPDAVKRIEGHVAHSLESQLEHMTPEELRQLAKTKELPPAIEAEVVTEPVTKNE